MEEVLALCRVLVNSTLLVHIYELLLRDLFIEVLVELPYHPLHLCLAHPHTHPP